MIPGAKSWQTRQPLICAVRKRAASTDQAFWTAMHAAFDDAEIADPTLAIGCWMAMGRFTHALGLDAVCMPGMIGNAAR